MQFDPIGDAVDEAAHAAFTELTGDRNPLHVDPLAARRLQFGERAVHGTHLVMRALATLEAATDLTGQRCARVSAKFLHSVPVGGALDADVERCTDDQWAVTVRHDVWIAVELRVWMQHGSPDRKQRATEVWPADRKPVERPRITPVGSSGTVPLVTADVEGPFGDVTADLLTLTRLVGMDMPGLHSLFSKFDMQRKDSASNVEAVRYTVASYDDRFGKLVIDVGGAVTAGTVTAFVRPAPTTQPSLSSWSTRPDPRDFGGQHALVVGGSRGLGEVTSQLLAAGGARVTVTHRSGADDARRVVDALPGVGHSTIELDVTDAADIAALATTRQDYTHLYYFASPPIFRGVNGLYSTALFDEFRAVYVDGFEAVAAALDVTRLSGVMVPSSVALDRLVGGMAEYTDAKRLAETSLADLSRRHGHLSVAAPRLPRLDTDQTASLMPTASGDAVAELLPVLRSVAGPKRA